MRVCLRGCVFVRVAVSAGLSVYGGGGGGGGAKYALAGQDAQLLLQLDHQALLLRHFDKVGHRAERLELDLELLDLSLQLRRALGLPVHQRAHAPHEVLQSEACAEHGRDEVEALARRRRRRRRRRVGQGLAHPVGRLPVGHIAALITRVTVHHQRCAGAAALAADVPFYKFKTS